MWDKFGFNIFYPYLMHGSAPEVVQKYILDRCVRSKISIILDGANIVEHESAIDAIVIDEHAREHHERGQTVRDTHFIYLFLIL